MGTARDLDGMRIISGAVIDSAIPESAFALLAIMGLGVFATRRRQRCA